MRSTIRRRRARTRSCCATAIQYRRQRDGDARAGRREVRSGSAARQRRMPASALFAALISRGDLTVADRTRAVPAGVGGRQRASRAGDRRRPSRQGSHRRARFLPRRIAIPSARSPRECSPGTRVRDGNSRCTRSSAPRASDAAAARPGWVKWRDKLPETERRYGNARLAYHAARQLNPRPTTGFARPAICRCRRKRRRGVRARRCAHRRGATCRRPSTPCPSRSAGVGVALLEGTRAGRHGATHAEAQRACSTRWPPTRISTACSPPKAWAGTSKVPRQRAAAIAARSARRHSACGPKCAASSSSRNST